MTFNVSIFCIRVLGSLWLENFLDVPRKSRWDCPILLNKLEPDLDRFTVKRENIFQQMQQIYIITLALIVLALEMYKNRNAVPKPLLITPYFRSCCIVLIDCADFTTCGTFTSCLMHCYPFALQLCSFVVHVIWLLSLSITPCDKTSENTALLYCVCAYG